MDVDVNKLVDQLQKIGGPIVDRVLEVYTRQQYNVGITEVATGSIQLVFAILLSVAAVIAFRKCIHWSAVHAKAYSIRYTAAEVDDSCGEAEFKCWIYASISGASVIIAIILFVISGLSLNDGILHLMNPQYYAIQEILGR